MSEQPTGPQDLPAAGPGQPQPYLPQPYAPQPYAPQPYAPQPHAPQPYAPQPYAQPGYPTPWAAAYDPSAPFGRDPMTGLPLSDKSKLAAGLLQLFLGTLGVGRFYTGHVGIAVAQLCLTLLGIPLTILFVGFFMLVGVGIWALVDAIVLLAGRPTDSRGFLLRP